MLRSTKKKQHRTFGLLLYGGGGGGGDLVIVRQGADTVDLKGTALQLKTYIGVVSPGGSDTQTFNSNIMAKKNYTWKLEEELVSKIQKLAEKEHRSLTNYIEVLFIEKSQFVAVAGYRDWEKK